MTPNKTHGGSTTQSLAVRIDGKFFAIGEHRFNIRGVTYGTFAPRHDGAQFPERERIKTDFAAMHEAGFNVVRTYTAPPDDLLDVAGDWDMRVLAGVFTSDWRYLVGASRRQRAAMIRDACGELREAARRYRDNDRVFAVCIGNEIPGDVVRWHGAGATAAALDRMVDAVRDEDPSQLVTYANYPTAEYLPLPDLDFVTFNVFLERRADLRRYLTRLQNLAGDRPLVLGELGLHTGNDDAGAHRQAELLDWQLETAIERGVAGACVFSWTDEWWVDAPVEGWHFGLTTADRTPRPALDVVQRWNHRTVRDLDVAWPRISVVVCAYNAAATLDECLTHTSALDYPGLEIVVVDDGSTDATAEIARRYERVRLVEIPHAGLSVARNAGYQAATGELVAYLDSDAYPSPEWLYFLALAFDAPSVGGAGGPNVPPVDDAFGAHVVAKAPGGPVHVLDGDDRAEHVPGCNMTFRKSVLEEVGGCNPIYNAAGDDVDLCWKVLDAGWEIGFHPAAQVWHHRRPGLRPYLRQQRGYGRSEALVEARHPERFTPLGTARWRGRIYDSFAPAVTGQRIYRGQFGANAYQSVYRGGGYALDLAHQVGVPAAVVALPFTLLGVLHPALWAIGVIAVAYVLGLGVIDAVRARPPRSLDGRRFRFRLSVAVHHLLQPLVRTWGRVRSRRSAWRDLPGSTELPSTLRRQGGVLIMESATPREETVTTIIDVVRRSGYRVITDAGWTGHDARIGGSVLVDGHLQTSAYPEGSVQIRVRWGIRWLRMAVAVLVVAIAAMLVPVLGAVLGALAVTDLAWGTFRTRRALPDQLLSARGMS